MNSPLRIYFTYLPLSLFISRDQQRYAEADCDIWEPWKDCGSFVDAIVGTVTNKANTSIYYYLVPDRLSTDCKTGDLE